MSLVIGLGIRFSLVIGLAFSIRFSQLRAPVGTGHSKRTHSIAREHIL